MLVVVGKTAAARRSAPAAHPGGKHTDPAINAYVQHYVRRWLEERPNEQVKLAELLGVAASAVSRIKNEGQGVGWGTARKVAEMMNVKFWELVREADVYWEQHKRKSGSTVLKSHPIWAELSRTLVKEHKVSRADLDLLGSSAIAISGSFDAKTAMALLAIIRGDAPEKSRPAKR